METEPIKKVSGGKITFIILICIISAALIYYSIMSIMSPERELARLKSAYGVITDEKNPVNQLIITDSAYLKMLRQKSFLQSRSLMAETDSIYFIVNLSDSTANLEISGVSVHETKIKSFRISSILMKGNEYSILTMLSTPLTIANSFATIKKEPVMIKMAPKDTSEYKPDVMPDTSIVEPVNFKLEMTNGIILYVYQEEKEKAADRISFRRFDISDRVTDTWNSVKSVAHFKIPQYHPFIKLIIPRADAKIIYRALPKKGQIAVYR